MKAFRYNLERILKLRKYTEREWELKLAEVTGVCIALKREIERDLEAKARELDQRYRRGVGTQNLDASNLFVARLDQQIQRNENKLRFQETRREEIQAKFLEAQRNRKVLDKLRERKEAAYLREQRLEEIAEIDDMNTGRSSRPHEVGETSG